MFGDLGACELFFQDMVDRLLRACAWNSGGFPTVLTSQAPADVSVSKIPQVILYQIPCQDLHFFVLVS